MEELLKQLLEKASTDKEVMRMLKNVAANSQQYELACRLREIEKEKFPDSLIEYEAKEKAKYIIKALSMCDIEIELPKTAWKVYAVLKHIDSTSLFTIGVANEINEKANKIFGGI